MRAYKRLRLGRCLGWDTLALIGDCTDIRPLQIIGADRVDLKAAFDMPEHPRPVAIATSVQPYRSDPRVCARIDAAIDSCQPRSCCGAIPNRSVPGLA
jgi:hypothetical protein